METTLVSLAQQINAEHAACEASLKAGLQHAVNAGRLLNRAKELCGHGAWAAWLAGNFAGSPRTAQTYMRVASRLPELEANAQRAAHLSLREAAQLLAEADGSDPGEGKAGGTVDGSPARVQAVLTIDQVMDRLKDAVARTWERCPPEYRAVIPLRISSRADELGRRGSLSW